MFNPDFNEKQLCADKDGKLKEKLIESCSNNSSGMYYTCVYGKCTSEYQTKIGKFENNGEEECTCTGTTFSDNCKTIKNVSGYYVYETNLYEYNYGDNKCTKVDNPVDGYYWNAHQYNQWVECVNGSCNAFTPKYLSDNEDNSDLITDTGYNIIFNGESISSILFKQSNENYQYKISGHVNSAFPDPEINYNIKFKKYSIILDPSESYTGNTHDKPGYYKISGTNKYEQCDSTSCNEVTLKTDCVASTIGKLFSKEGNVALCLNFFDDQPISISVATTGKYLMKSNTNNIFGLLNDQYGLINITQDSITLSEEQNAIRYRYTKIDHKILTERKCVPSEINEFKIVNGKTNIYTLNCSEVDTTELCKNTN